MEQRTDEWFAARLGKVTSSRIYDIMPGKTGYKAARKNYMAELVAERLSGEPTEHYTTAAMQWGIDTEPLARSEYEALNGVMVEEAGFIESKLIPFFGGSPDGLVGSDGIIEIKCPNTATHIETLTSGKTKPEYYYQMQGLMMCTDRLWCDFVSYDPRIKRENLIMYQKRIYFDEVAAASITIEVNKFLAELDETMKKLEAI